MKFGKFAGGLLAVTMLAGAGYAQQADNSATPTVELQGERLQYCTALVFCPDDRCRDMQFDGTEQVTASVGFDCNNAAGLNVDMNGQNDAFWLDGTTGGVNQEIAYTATYNNQPLDFSGYFRPQPLFANIDSGLPTADQGAKTHAILVTPEASPAVFGGTYEEFIEITVTPQ